MLRIEVPPLMNNILKDINRAVLKEQSSLEDPDRVLDRQEILDLISNLLNTMARLRDTTGENPLEVTDLIEAFDQEAEPDLQIIDSYVTDGTKIDSLSSLPSNKSATPAAKSNEAKQGDIAGSLSSLPSNKSVNAAVKADESKQGDVAGSLSSLPSNKSLNPAVTVDEPKQGDVAGSLSSLPEVAEDEQKQGADLVVDSIVRGVSECLVKDTLEQ